MPKVQNPESAVVDPTAGVGEVVDTNTGETVAAAEPKPKRTRKPRVEGTFPTTTAVVFTSDQGHLLKTVALARSTPENKITYKDILVGLMQWAFDSCKDAYQAEADAYIAAHPVPEKSTRTRTPSVKISEMTPEQIEQFLAKQDAARKKIEAKAAEAQNMLETLRKMRANATA